MGSIFAVPPVKLDLPNFLGLCRTWPGETVGTHMKAAESYRRTYKLPTLFVMGSEGCGLSEAAAGACSTLVHIPMKGGRNNFV